MQGLIGQGVVVDLEIMFNEIEEFKKYGLDVESNLKISGKAAVLMPYHKERCHQRHQRQKNEHIHKHFQKHRFIAFFERITVHIGGKT